MSALSLHPEIKKGINKQENDCKLMTFTPEGIILVGAVLLFVSIIVSKAGFRFGVPTLLVFLMVGMVFGSDGLGLQFHNAAEAQFIGMISLCVILFSGGMDTNFKEIRPVLGAGISLSTLGVLLTTLFTGLFIYGLSHVGFSGIGLPLMTSLLLAATMSSTDSASVFNILRSQRMHLKHNLRPMLELESGSNDPMAYMLTIALIQVIQSEGMSLWGILGLLLVQFTVGGLGGYLLGRLMVRVINRINLNNSSLYPLLLLSGTFLIFTIVSLLKGNGYLAVYIAGMVVGNAHKLTNRREMASFMDGMTWLFQIVMFLSLGLLVNPHEMLDIAIPAILIGLFMMVVSRPLSVFISLLPFRGMGLSSRWFVSWVGLRGAVPIIFATYPVVAEVEGARVIFNIVFFITILSLVIQGSTISTVARRLRLDEPMPEEEDTFGVEIPEEVGTKMRTIILTTDLLADGDTLRTMNLPQGTLVMLVRREGEYIVPNGSLQLFVGDELLVISGKTTDGPEKVE